MFDVAVLGAGLGGLSAARDLARAGADVIVLEARHRPGGRVALQELPDGGVVQTGGEVFGHGHTAYRELVAELGLEVLPSYVADPGQMSWGLHEGVYVGDEPPWMSAGELADLARVEREFAALGDGLDPADPWSFPDAAALDRLSVAAWLRSVDALPAVRRRLDLASLSLSCDAPDRTSLLAELRKHAVLGGNGFYDLERWEGLKVASGSASVALAMAAEMEGRLRFHAVVKRIRLRPNRVRITLLDDEVIESEAVICAIPAAPLRDIRIDGLSDARLKSLHAQRHALAAKIVAVYEDSFWQRNGQNGLAECEWLFGSTWPQGPGTLSLLVPPERLAAYVAAPHGLDDVRAGLRALYGDEAATPSVMVEHVWGLDEFTRGYIASWAPGDLARVGPLHGTHEPPFYVAGSDHWVAGYMEGAVRTGRDAARAALGAGVS